MNRFLIRAAVACTTFVLGVACTGIWITKPPSVPIANKLPKKCEPFYDANVVQEAIAENDDPDWFRAFQELPLYAMPACVDEAYSLAWIPSFHEPVLVRVWRVGDESFLTAKKLDSKGYRFGSLKESYARSLTKAEWRDITDRLIRANFWQLSETTNDPVPNDGAVWFLDGWNSRQYHWVSRRIPKDQYAEICKRLIQLSGLETGHDLYLP